MSCAASVYLESPILLKYYKIKKPEPRDVAPELGEAENRPNQGVVHNASMVADCDQGPLLVLDEFEKYPLVLRADFDAIQHFKKLIINL